jgi:hypothetical protein
MLDFICSLFGEKVKDKPANYDELHWTDKELHKRPIYLEVPRKTPTHSVFCFCSDCEKMQPMATNCTCFVCGSKSIAVRCNNNAPIRTDLDEV